MMRRMSRGFVVAAAVPSCGGMVWGVGWDRGSRAGLLGGWRVAGLVVAVFRVHIYYFN